MLDERATSWPSILTHFREEFHCFEVSQIRELAGRFKKEMVDAAFPSVASVPFLPAERTWLEWKDDKGDRLWA